MRWFLLLGLCLSCGQQQGAPLRVLPLLSVMANTSGDLHLRFAPVTPPDAGTSTFQLQNVGRATLTVTKLELFGDDGGLFEIEPPLPPPVSPGDKAILTARFTPREPGDFSARLLVESNAEGGRNSDLILCGRAVAELDGGTTPICDAPQPPPIASPPLPPAQGCTSVATLGPVLVAAVLLRRRRPSQAGEPK